MTNECMSGTDLLLFLNQFNFIFTLLSDTFLQAIAEMGQGQAFYWEYNEAMNQWCIQ